MKLTTELVKAALHFPVAHADDCERIIYTWKTQCNVHLELSDAYRIWEWYSNRCDSQWLSVERYELEIISALYDFTNHKLALCGSNIFRPS